MSEQPKQYTVRWHTRPGPGAAYYSGKTTITADDRDSAADQAQRRIHRQFEEYPLAHIVVYVEEE